ncbi:MAG TPA: hypothetical protein VEG64_07135 [Candidatus Sulfotelmatobacter sp.]|nr:hypothetical protein [Candidatus Sulfotelmatobacter sp.]
MRKLIEVQEATELMNEALDWSLFTWLFQKSRVRETADCAKAALDHAERAVKARWSGEAKAAYQNLTGKRANPSRKRQTDSKPAKTVDAEVLVLIEQVVDADTVAERARIDAEDTFDEADRLSDVPMAREGCRIAIRSWSLREKAIRKAEIVAEQSPATRAS